MWNTWMESGGGEIPGGELGFLFVSAHGGKLGLSEGSVGRTLVSISGGGTGVAVM